MNSHELLTALQSFLDQQGVEVDRLQAADMVRHMVAWYRLGSVDKVARAASGDALIYRYSGWSEGCATGFKLSLLRRVVDRAADGAEAEWFAGITLLFDPSRFGEVTAFNTISSDWQSVDSFARAIESSPGYRLSAGTAPMGAMLEIGGMR